MADPGIDPRYAAQFQRGFDPATEAPVERRGPLRIEVPRAMVQRVPEPPPLAQRVPDPPPLAQRAAPLRPTAAPGGDVEEFPAAPPRTEWALLVAGLGLLGLAGLLFMRAVDDASRFSGVGPDLTEQLLSMAAGTLTGPLLVGGVVAILLWVVLRAVRPGASRG